MLTVLFLEMSISEDTGSLDTLLCSLDTLLASLLMYPRTVHLWKEMEFVFVKVSKKPWVKGHAHE